MYHFHVDSKTRIQMNLFTKEKQIPRHRKQIYSSQRGKGWGEESMRSLRLADSNYYIQINDKDLPYSTGNCIQYHVINSNGKGKKRASVSIISRQWPQNKHNVSRRTFGPGRYWTLGSLPAQVWALLVQAFKRKLASVVTWALKTQQQQQEPWASMFPEGGWFSCE